MIMYGIDCKNLERCFFICEYEFVGKFKKHLK